MQTQRALELEFQRRSMANSAQIVLPLPVGAPMKTLSSLLYRAWKTWVWIWYVTRVSRIAGKSWRKLTLLKDLIRPPSSYSRSKSAELSADMGSDWRSRRVVCGGNLFGSTRC